MLLLILGMFEGFTGYLLPFDQTAYWATVVGMNITANGPFVGGDHRPRSCRGAPRSGATRCRASTRCTCSIAPGADLRPDRPAPVPRHPPRRHARRRGRRRPRARTTSSPSAEPPARAGLVSPTDAREADAVSMSEAKRSRSQARRDEFAPLQGGRPEAGEAVLPVRDVPRHGHEPRRRGRDHRARRASGSGRSRRPHGHAAPAGSGRSTPTRPTRGRRASCRGPTGTSTSSSTCSGSSSGRTR